MVTLDFTASEDDKVFLNVWITEHSFITHSFFIYKFKDERNYCRVSLSLKNVYQV